MWTGGVSLWPREDNANEEKINQSVVSELVEIVARRPTRIQKTYRSRRDNVSTDIAPEM